MSVPTNTPFMGLPLATIGQDYNYVTDISTAFALINVHDHDTIGKEINQNSIDWTTYDGSPFSLLNIGGLNFIPQTVRPTILTSLYFFTDNLGTDLWFNDANGNNIRITVQGHVNNITSVNGFIGDFKTFNAAVVYNLSANSYTFSSAVGPSDLEAFTAEFNGNGSVTTLTGNFTANFTSNNFTITSPGFFFVGDLCCFSNFYLQEQPVTSFMRVQSPRLVSTTNQLQNNNANYPIRYNIDNGNTGPFTLFNITSNIVVSRIPLIALGPGNTFFNPGGNSARNYQSCQEGWQLGQSNTGRQYNHGAGSIFGVVPRYNAANVGGLGAIDVVILEISLAPTVFNNAFFVPRVPNICVVSNGSYTPQLTYFLEQHIQYIAPISGNLVYSVNYGIQVVNYGTGQKVSDYKVIVRV